MNELRMYVEHLFEGRVLTAEMIELKEEIYGNLVARYEDYVAGGMGEAEALAQAKASITSIDDVLAGEGEDAFEGAASSASEDAEPTAVLASDDDAGESTCEEGAATEGAAATVVQPAPATASTADASDHKSPWLKILAVAAAIIAVILVATVLWNVVLEPTGDQLEDTVEDVVDVTVAGGAGQTSNGNNQGTAGGNGAGANANTSDTPTFSDPEDQREYEATMAVLDEIDAHDPTSLQAYTGDSQPSSVFFENLPLGSYVSADETGSINAGTFEVYYVNVSEDIDGDAIDRAIVYNAAAAFSAYPNLQRLNVVVHEAYDEHHDADVYAFDRSQLERAFANASGDAVTQFNSSLFESEASWDVVRQQIDRHDFCDHQMDVAERS
ncbi:hypothetical protein [uncultured Enorma sp.]|uniref:hypothetical protein n=1 Tax=uncultured Enorma sp. TaxID=1714346 RepID=UPI00261DBA63|nr:hypothetical protein [uncultured Enorma sp.]